MSAEDVSGHMGKNSNSRVTRDTIKTKENKMEATCPHCRKKMKVIKNRGMQKVECANKSCGRTFYCDTGEDLRRAGSSFTNGIFNFTPKALFLCAGVIAAILVIILILRANGINVNLSF